MKINKKITISFFAAILVVGLMLFLSAYFLPVKTKTLSFVNEKAPEEDYVKNAKTESAQEEKREIVEILQEEKAKQEQPTEKKERENMEAKTEKKEPASKEIKTRLINWGFTQASKRDIDTVIIHSSYDALGEKPYDLAGLLKEYKQYGVAPHYLIDREGNVFQLVAEKNIAYHAGAGETPDGRKNVNDFSIGIELMNTEKDKYTGSQYVALNRLLRGIKGRHKIKYVLGHNQIAPGRKTDPWNFDWSKI